MGIDRVWKTQRRGRASDAPRDLPVGAGAVVAGRIRTLQEIAPGIHTRRAGTLARQTSPQGGTDPQNERNLPPEERVLLEDSNERLTDTRDRIRDDVRRLALPRGATGRMTGAGGPPPSSVEYPPRHRPSARRARGGDTPPRAVCSRAAVDRIYPTPTRHPPSPLVNFRTTNPRLRVLVLGGGPSRSCVAPTPRACRVPGVGGRGAPTRGGP